MAITTLDPQTALVVIDMQKGIMGMPTVHPATEVLANVVRLVEAFRAKPRPVVLVHVGFGPDGSDAIKPRSPRGDGLLTSSSSRTSCAPIQPVTFSSTNANGAPFMAPISICNCGGERSPISCCAG
jgi:nicotinamidase-related amidase